MTDSKQPFDEAMGAALAALGVACTSEQVDLFWRHFTAMCDANRTHNLTRITDPVDAAVLHYVDSLALIAWTDRNGILNADVLDVGTGAGFPAVPVAIVRREWRVTAIDGTKKKVAFVRHIAAELAIDNLECVHAHGDHFKSAKKFDIVTCRAVSDLASCLETAARFLKPGGWAVAYKTANLKDDEAKEGEATARRLGFRSHPPFRYQLTAKGETFERVLDIRQKC